MGRQLEAGRLRTAVVRLGRDKMTPQMALIFWALVPIGVYAAVWELERIRQILTSIKDASSSKRLDQR
jgi:hypothetical protein